MAAQERPDQLDSPVVAALIKLGSRANTRLYRLTRGRLGKTWRIGAGLRNPAPVCLLTSVGRKSGQKHTVPLIYLRDGDNIVVVASQGGMKNNPAWYLNVTADPAVTIEVDGKKLALTARTADADEKAALWPRGRPLRRLRQLRGVDRARHPRRHLRAVGILAPHLADRRPDQRSRKAARSSASRPLSPTTKDCMVRRMISAMSSRTGSNPHSSQSTAIARHHRPGELLADRRGELPDNPETQLVSAQHDADVVVGGQLVHHRDDPVDHGLIGSGGVAQLRRNPVEQPSDRVHRRRGEQLTGAGEVAVDGLPGHPEDARDVGEVGRSTFSSITPRVATRMRATASSSSSGGFPPSHGCAWLISLAVSTTRLHDHTHQTIVYGVVTTATPARA